MFTEALEEWIDMASRVRRTAKRVLSGSGPQAYEKWLREKYYFPLVPGMPGYTEDLNRSPLTKAEEKSCTDKFLAKHGGGLTRFFGPPVRTASTKKKAAEPPAE